MREEMIRVYYVANVASSDLSMSVRDEVFNGRSEKIGYSFTCEMRYYR